MKNKYLKSTIFSIAIQGYGAVALLMIEFYLAKALGVSDFGIYSTVSAWLNILQMIAIFGFNQLLLKLIPKY